MYILCRLELLLTNDTQTKKRRRRSLQNIDSNVVLNLTRQSKQTRIVSALSTQSLSSSLLQSLSSSPSSRIRSVRSRFSFAVISSLHTASLPIFINFLDSIQSSRRTISASRSTNISRNAYRELIVNYRNDEHTLELFTKRCLHCTALHWKFESVLDLYSYIICCFKDDELLDSLPDSSSLIKSLFEDDTAQSKHFLNHIRDYNHALIFTSCMYTANKRLAHQHEIQAFIVHDELYHLQKSLHSSVQELSCFAQLYFHDSAQMITMRLTQSFALHESLLRQLNEMIQACENSFIDMYKSARELLEAARQSTNSMRVILNSQLKLIVERDSDQRRTTLLTISEVAVFISDEYNEIEHRDIVVAKRTAVDEESRFHRISHDNVVYFSLHYVLFFSEGKSSWHWALRLRNDDHSRIKTRYSRRAWLWYHLFERSDQYSVVQRDRRLFQQYIVDCFAIVDQSQLKFFRHNQKIICADIYKDLADAITQKDDDSKLIDCRMILSSSYIEEDRWMQQLYQNFMIIARHFEKSIMFVTCTANLHWLDIIVALESNQRVENQSDIVAQVFHEKIKTLLQNLKIQYDRYLDIVWTIEYQKRDLSYIHILLFLHRENNFLERACVNELICAKLSNLTVDLNESLRRIVESQMTHDSCNVWNSSASCMKDNSKDSERVCEKKFSKLYQIEIIIQIDDYSLYRRRQNDRIWMKRVNDRDVHLNNTWVMSYNLYLTRKYSAHINVEICNSVQIIKYIHKYVYKEEDRTIMKLKNNSNKITCHLNDRYIFSNQAAWNLFKFRSHIENSFITRLIVHLSDEQSMYFSKNVTTKQI